MTDEADLDSLDRAVLNGLQGGFPVVERPFRPTAAAFRQAGIDVTATALHRRVRSLDERGVLSRFGPLVNAEAIGGAATLVAMHVPEDRFESVADQVNAHREVAHNYEREHPHLNMWFVVSVADPAAIDDVLASIEAETGLETYNLPKCREFGVEAIFPVEGPTPGDIDLSHLGPDVSPADRTTLTDDEGALVAAIQDGFPPTATPYRDVADAVDRPIEWVLETIQRFERAGKIRRIGVVPNHYALGYTENGMTVWDVPAGILEDAGPAVASLEFVTHCYQRPRHEGVWPYNFFAMTHGRTRTESDEHVQRVREVMAEYWDVGPDDWDTLFSTRVLKKTGIRLDERARANAGR